MQKVGYRFFLLLITYSCQKSTSAYSCRHCLIFIHNGLFSLFAIVLAVFFFSLPVLMKSLWDFFFLFSGIRSWDTNLMDCNIDQELKLFVSRHSARFSADTKGKTGQTMFIKVTGNPAADSFFQTSNVGTAALWNPSLKWLHYAKV